MENEQSEAQKNNTMKFAIPLIGVLVIGLLGFALMRPATTPEAMPQDSAPVGSTAPVESSVPAMTDTAISEEAAYKDGTYTVVGNYTSPGGQEELSVTLTIAGDIVTDSEVEVLATRPISKERQEDFAANYKTQVIGKNIAELQLGKVSGSSLTPKGFNDALEKIKAEAQS